MLGNTRRSSIGKITMDTSFQSPIRKKDISTINDSGYIESKIQVDKLSDSKEQVDPNINPRVDTYNTDGNQKLSIIPSNFEPVIIRQDLVMSV